MGVNLQVMPNSAVRRSALAASAGDEGQLGLEASTSHLSLCQFDVDASYMSGGVLSAELSPGNSAHGGRGAQAALLAGCGPSPGAGRGQAAEGRQHGGVARQGGTAPSPRGPSATRTVLSMANKARDLLQKQGAIEAEVEDRWVPGVGRGALPTAAWYEATGALCLEQPGPAAATALSLAAETAAPGLATRWLAGGSARVPPAAAGWAPACRPCASTCMGGSNTACCASGAQGASGSGVAGFGARRLLPFWRLPAGPCPEASFWAPGTAGSETLSKQLCVLPSCPQRQRRAHALPGARPRRRQPCCAAGGGAPGGGHRCPGRRPPCWHSGGGGRRADGVVSRPANRPTSLAGCAASARLPVWACARLLQCWIWQAQGWPTRPLPVSPAERPPSQRHR